VDCPGSCSSPNNTLLWGPLTMPWETMRKATTCWTRIFLVRLTQRIQEQWRMKVMTNLMAEVVWLNVAQQRADRPAFLVSRWRFREATDSRDKVYALMSLCPSGSMPCMENYNYDMSAVDVFGGLTSDLMRSEKSLFPLIMDPRLELEKATPGIPVGQLMYPTFQNGIQTGFTCMPGHIIMPMGADR
jgi:hypothetical protein